MISIENPKGNIVKLVVPQTLKSNDFRQLAPQADALIGKHGRIRLLIDATHFGGWENMQAFEAHMGFVKNHHQKIERAALIAGHAWQRWLAGAVAMFAHPQIRTFEQAQAAEAAQWLES